MSKFGTIVRGIKAPIIQAHDPLEEIVFESVVSALKEDNIEVYDQDIVAITEAIVARAQNNYVTIDDIAQDVQSKFDKGTVGLVFPILSRNRFSMLLKGIAQGVERLVVQLSYPGDEVGNPLLSYEQMEEAKINPYTDHFDEASFRSIFPTIAHPFTGVDYIQYYKTMGGDNVEIILSNDPTHILNYTDQVIVADIHTRFRTQKKLRAHGAKKVLRLDELLTKPIQNSGYNPEFGLLGSNLANERSVKLFPRDCQALVERLQERFRTHYQKEIEVMVYGDGAFKDPVGGIWELADPIVSPGFTKRLAGTPNELKLKYIADTTLKHLKGKELEEAMRSLIKGKDKNLVNNILSQGTTPRRLTDLLGSLCDLTSGSGDKGTPIVFIQGYFDNYSK